MKYYVTFLLLISLSYSRQSPKLQDDIEIETNEIPNTDNHENAFADVAASFLGNNGGDIGNVLNNFIQQDGGKAVESLLMGAAQNPDAAGQILSGIGSMLNHNNAGAALDPSLIGNVISMMGAGNKQNGQDQISSTIMSMVTSMISESQKKKSKDQFDMGSIFNAITYLFQDTGENPMSLLMDSLGSFFGPEAAEREHEHASHAFLLPPLLEKMHVYFDHFRHTELYKALWRITGGEKFYNMFAVDGTFSFTKFFNRLENKSFRRHWIQAATKKITDIIAVVTDPNRHKSYANTGVSLFNGFLKSMEFPKSTLFDITRPTETLTNFVQYFFKKYLSMDIEARQYVKPAVKYVEDVLRLAQQKGFLFSDGINSSELAQKLTDTLNLEIIEPVSRVWRAYRFARKVPDCDKYVMCYINQEDPNEKLSLPGLKKTLSKTASLTTAWFLSQHTGTSFWTLYSTINDETDCSVRFFEKCNEFHEEEAHAHQEYEHTEL